MTYFKYIILFTVLSFTACQKDINLNDKTQLSETVIDKQLANSEADIQNSLDSNPCLNATQIGYDENGCCVYSVKLRKGVRYNGRTFSLNATNDADVTHTIEDGVICWEVVVCNQSKLTLISEANETSYIECNMDLYCTPEENCCDDFCIEVTLTQEVDENGCFQIELTFFQYCIGNYLFHLDEKYELLNDMIEVQSSQKSIKISMCNTFEGYNIENFNLEGTLFTQNCGTIQIGPVFIFNGETDPVICNPGGSI